MPQPLKKIWDLKNWRKSQNWAKKGACKTVFSKLIIFLHSQGGKLRMNKPEWSSKCGLGELKNICLGGVKSEEIEILVNCLKKLPHF